MVLQRSNDIQILSTQAEQIAIHHLESLNKPDFQFVEQDEEAHNYETEVDELKQIEEMNRIHLRETAQAEALAFKSEHEQNGMRNILGVV